MEPRAIPVLLRLREKFALKKKKEEEEMKEAPAKLKVAKRVCDETTFANLQRHYNEIARKEDEAYYAHHRALPPETQKLREEAYALYTKSTPRPHPISRFKWVPCLLCRKVITDDPYGHNPFPLCEVDDQESRVCGSCNASFVLPARLRCIEADIKSPSEARVFLADYEKDVYALFK